MWYDIHGVIIMTTGERIRAARKNANMTQAELAQKLGISYVGVSQWENGLRQPKYETLKKIADAIGVEWYDLVPPEESTRMIAAHTSDIIAREENQGKAFVKTWPPEPTFPSDNDRHMAGLTDLYYRGVLHWAEDGLFSEAETITIKMHFSELLLKYKQLIERIVYTKRSLEGINEAEFQQILIQQRLADDLKKELDELKAWIDTISLYFSAAVPHTSEQPGTPFLSEE